MKNKNLFIIYLTLLIYLVISGTGLSNAILCFGEDGHVKVEFSLCHNSAEAVTEHDELTHNSCGECTDIPLFTDKRWNHNVLSFHTFQTDDYHTIYFYYPVQIKKAEIKPDKIPFFERLNYPKISFINTTTTVLLN